MMALVASVNVSVIIGAQRSYSALMNFVRSSGDPPRRTTPRVVALALNSLLCRTSLIALLSLSMIGFGVPAGAKLATHAVNS